jgi:hypothetical protein
MSPTFSSKTIDTLAKRSGFLCSNPECRVATVGPNTEPDKATTIGEAAHIFGARPDAARYDALMNDAARAEITNGIWLCRNCHKLVDRDAGRFPAELLYRWREEHERFIAENLGTAGDRIRFDIDDARLREFADYPPLVRRLVIDQPRGWEWRLTAELMRHLNQPVFRRLRDLKSGLYTRPLERVEDDAAVRWISARLGEMQVLVSPLEKLLAQLMASWGKPGEPGDVSEIHHVCCLIRDALERIAQHEERLWFVDIDDQFHPMVELLKDCLGSQAAKMASIPEALDEFFALLDTDHGGTKENPRVVKKTITFELPSGWERRVSREMKRLASKSTGGPDSGSSWSSIVIGIIAVVIVYVLFF